MATFYADEIDSVLDTENADYPEKVRGTISDARVRRYRATIDLSAKTVESGDTIVLADIPERSAFAFGIINATATMGGTATIAIGVAGTTGKYRAAATFTTANTPTLFGVAAAHAGAENTDTERVIATVAAANLPTSGTLIIDLYYSGR